MFIISYKLPYEKLDSTIEKLAINDVYNVFYENQIFSYNEKQVLNYCSLEENSLKINSTDTNYVYGSFILNCINSSYNAEVNFKYSLNTSSKEVIGLTYFSNQNVEEV